MTTVDKIYSVADPNINEFDNKQEKEVLLNLDTTKIKEMIIQFKQRTKDLDANILVVEESYKGERHHFNNDLLKSEREIQDLKRDIMSYQEKIKKSEETHEFRMKEMTKNLSFSQEEKTQNLKSELDDLLNYNADLKKKQSDLQEFERKQPGLESEISTLKNELKFEKTALKNYELQIQEQKQKMIESLNKDLQHIETMKGDIKDLEKKTRGGKVSFAEKKKKVFLEVDKNRKENSNLIIKSKQVKMENIVSNDCLSEYQNLNYKQAKSIKNLKTEVQYVKFRLSEELYKFANQLELLKKERAAMQQEFQDSLENLGSHISLKTNEVNNLRFIARCVLTQKSELDKFFLETIEYLSQPEEGGKGAFSSEKILHRSGLNTVTYKYPFVKPKQMFWGRKGFEGKVKDTQSLTSLPPLFPRPQSYKAQADDNDVPSKVDLKGFENIVLQGEHGGHPWLLETDREVSREARAGFYAV